MFLLAVSVFFISSFINLKAETVTISTPGGSISMEVSGNQTNSNVISSGSVIDNIGIKLETLEKNYLSKLGRLDKMKSKKVMDDIFVLLASLPSDTDISVNQQTSSNSNSQGSINMSISANSQNTSFEESSSNQDEEIISPMSNSDF